jgi:hypothetical protein
MSQASASASTATSEEQKIKKFRAYSYDIHDETYATKLKKVYREYTTESAQKAFDNFTDNLMLETHIHRYSLLNAIDEYNKTEDGQKFPLTARYGSIFEDNAFNFRPYQCW